jgi:hypothetical protein
VRDAVDQETARAADALAAVVLECDRFFAFEDQVFVHDIQQLQHRHVGIHVAGLVAHHAAARLRALLPPDVQDQAHYL